MPGIGIGCPPLLHAHIGDDGFFVSLLEGDIPPPTLKGPIEIGNKHDQQISLIGLTNLLLHDTLAIALVGIIIAIIIAIIYRCKCCSWSLARGLAGLEL